MNGHDEPLADDVLVACADLVGRAGATSFELGHLDDDPDDSGWFAVAYYRGARITSAQCPSPSLAALALAERLLAGATCKCRRPVTLTDARPGCRWRLVGARWEPGCTAAPFTVTGRRGDVAAMRQAVERNPT